MPNMKLSNNDLLLYAVTDSRWLNGATLSSCVEMALKGGATFIQLREKKLDHDSFFNEAKEIKALCAKFGVPFVINDNVELALEVGADGVHVGQSDMEAGSVRSLLGNDKILGVSAQTPAEAILAEKRGADYIGVGAVFPTGTKRDADQVSFETLSEICRSVSIPVIAIGGINKENLSKLANSGIVGIAVVSAIFAASDKESATAELRTISEELFSR